MDNVLNRPLFAGKVSADPSGAINRQYRQPSIRPAGLPSLSVTQADAMADDRSLLFTNALLAAAQEEVQMAQNRFENDPSGVNQQLYADAVSKFEAAQKESENVKSTYLPGPIREIKDRGVLDVEGPEAAVSQMTPEQLDIFNNLERAADNPAPDTTIPKVTVPGSPILGRSGMEMEARDRGPRAATTPSPAPAQPTAQQGPDFERTGRQGPLVTDPAKVAAGLNAEDPAVRERTLADFMKEFTDQAPKYEGTDKNLMLAQIGFAIAAGESPNAMQNISNGLLAGSELMIKDKAAKDEFNRQIQLSAMQYGLENKAQDRALGRQFTNYVASKDVTYRGKKYGPNESVPVIHSDIINGRMPDGVITEGSSDALVAADASIRKSMAEAVKNQTLTAPAYQEAIKTLDTAAADYSSARNLMPLLEASLIRVANGEVTGINSALTKKMNEVMNAVGLKPQDSYESPEAFEAALRQVSVTMVQDLLGESGKTISDADRKLIDGLIGLQQDIVSGVVKDPDILTRKVQELMRVLEGKQQNALDSYTTAMEGYGGTYTPSGTPTRSIRAERVFNEEAAAPEIQYEWDQASNRLILKNNGG